MAITQLSVFLENVPGTLCKAVSAISGAGINIRALSVADTRDFGIMRLIVPDVEQSERNPRRLYCGRDKSHRSQNGGPHRASQRDP